MGGYKKRLCGCHIGKAGRLGMVVGTSGRIFYLWCSRAQKVVSFEKLFLGNFVTLYKNISDKL